MKDYITLILITYFLSFVAEWIRSSKIETARKLYSAKIHWLFVFLTIITLVYYSAKRSTSFGDTGSYWSIFQNDIVVSDIKDCWNILSWDENNAFYALSGVIKLYITQNRETYLAIIAALINTPIIFFFYKYTKSFELSILIYFLSTSFNFTLNGMKQSFAIMLVAISVWMIEKKLWYLYFPFLFFLVMQFHRSSMIFFIIFIILNIDIKNKPEIKKNMPYIILALGALLLISSPVTKGFFASFAEDTNYGNYSNAINSGSTGSNPIRILISIIPFVLGMAFRKYIEPHEKYYHIFMCMTAFSTVFYMLGVIFVFYARFALYFNIFTIPLMTWVVYYAPKNKRKWLYLFLVLFYSTYFYFELFVSLGFVWDSNIFNVIDLKDLLAG